jgi:hypothetical protein
MDILESLTQHRTIAIIVVAVSLWISLSLIARLWIIHRQRAFLAKLAWSLILLASLLGWIMYGAFFSPPSVSDIRAPTEHSRDAMYGGGGHV